MILPNAGDERGDTARPREACETPDEAQGAHDICWVGRLCAPSVAATTSPCERAHHGGC